MCWCRLFENFMKNKWGGRMLLLQFKHNFVTNIVAIHSVTFSIETKRKENLIGQTQNIRKKSSDEFENRPIKEPSQIKSTVDDITIGNIRNFSIIAHVDHGKSTLADRLLEKAGVMPENSGHQVLDRLQVEKERGITVKAQTASFIYGFQGVDYLFNLIDTPGHVDFSYEVTRSLAACQGVVLLVDANQGVQAQTVACFYLAFTSNLVVIPVLNKVDLKNADPDGVAAQMKTLFDIPGKDILKVSAKLGTGVDALFQAIIERIPPPSGKKDSPFCALLFDSWFDRYRGVVALVALKNGTVKPGDEIASCNTKKRYVVRSVGIVQPLECATPKLCAGQVGFLTCNMRTAKEANIGDTLCAANADVEPLPGFRQTKPVVFAGVYPADQSQHPALRSAIEKLVLNDSSVNLKIDSSPALGQGWRLGFLGLLHLEVFGQRLEQEYGAQVVLTAPSVTYKALVRGEKNVRKYGGEEISFSNPAHFPETSIVTEFFEPMALGTVVTPDDYLGAITGLCMERRGVQKSSVNVDRRRVMLQFYLPLSEIIVDFHDRLKSVSSGYASFNYEDAGYQPANLVKMNILLNGKIVEELSTIVIESQASRVGKKMCARLEEMIPRQLFQIAIQAAVGGKIVARENIKAVRKDVTAKCYGGDISRKMKLLKRQAEGKKRMRLIGNIEVPRDTFIQVLKR